MLVALDVSSTLDFVPCLSRELNRSIFLLKQRSLQGLPNVPRSTNPSFIRGDLLQNDRIWEQEPCVFFAKQKSLCISTINFRAMWARTIKHEHKAMEFISFDLTTSRLLRRHLRLDSYMDSWRNTHGEKWALIEELHQKKIVRSTVLLDEDNCTLFWGWRWRSIQDLLSFLAEQILQKW